LFYLFGKKIVLFHFGKDTLSFSFNQEFRKNNWGLNSIMNDKLRITNGAMRCRDGARPVSTMGWLGDCGASPQ
jgi:hypothetical protein